MRKATATLTLAVAVMVTGCSGDESSLSERAPATSAGAAKSTTTRGPTTTAAAVKILTEAENGTTVALAKGDRFEVRLAWCVSCGHHWEPQAGDPAIVTIEGKRDEAPSNQPGVAPTVGGSGYQVFTYEVVGTGSTTVELGSIPPGRDKPTETWKVTITAD